MSESTITSFKQLYRKHYFDKSESFCFNLWHYTSVEGLTGIIRNTPNEHSKLHFWFSRSDCLNDPSEGTHILSMFTNVCSNLLRDKRISDDFFNSIIQIDIPNDQFIYFPIPPDKDHYHVSMLECVPCDAYICSFSLKEDSLDMWRYYSKGKGGYGLKLYSRLFDEYKEYEHSDYKEEALFSLIRSYKVIYDNQAKEELLSNLVMDTFSAFMNSPDAIHHKKSQSQHFIRSTLKELQFIFKHECYSSEQEYRYVFYLPQNKPPNLKNELPIVKYRVSGAVLVPYIDLEIDNGDSYLSEIIISPFIESNTTIKTTNDYLTHCGFKCKARKSILPVRQ